MFPQQQQQQPQQQQPAPWGQPPPQQQQQPKWPPQPAQQQQQQQPPPWAQPQQFPPQQQQQPSPWGQPPQQQPQSKWPPQPAQQQQQQQPPPWAQPQQFPPQQQQQQSSGGLTCPQHHGLQAHTGGGWQCGVCGDSHAAADGGFLCGPCRWSICRHCREKLAPKPQVVVNSPLLCPSGHQLYARTTGNWHCNQCRDSFNEPNGALQCAGCDWDICARCQQAHRQHQGQPPPQGYGAPPPPPAQQQRILACLCPQGHDARPRTRTGSWNCDTCRENHQSPDGANRCDKCDWDICAKCQQKGGGGPTANNTGFNVPAPQPLRCPKGHATHLRTMGGWNCDNCRENHPSPNGAMRCDKCDWDICAKCQRK